MQRHGILRRKPDLVELIEEEDDLVVAQLSFDEREQSSGGRREHRIVFEDQRLRDVLLDHPAIGSLMTQGTSNARWHALECRSDHVVAPKSLHVFGTEPGRVSCRLELERQS